MFALGMIIASIVMNLTIITGTNCQYRQEAGTAQEFCQAWPRHDFNDPVLNQRHINQVLGAGLTEAEIRSRAADEYRARVLEGDTRVVPPGTYADADAAAEAK